MIAEMRTIDAPALAAKRASTSAPASARCPASPTCAAAVCCWRPSWPTAATPRPCTQTCSTAVWSPTPSRATALRFAPPLTVSEAELDEAVAIVAEVLAMRHLLDVTDLTADELVQVLDLSERSGSAPRARAGSAWR